MKINIINFTSVVGEVNGIDRINFYSHRLQGIDCTFVANIAVHYLCHTIINV